MNKKMKQAGLALCCLALIFTTVGCVPLVIGAAAGVGGYAWVNGELAKDYPVSTEKLYRAALRGVKSLNLIIVSEKSDRLSGKINAKFADGKTVDVNVEAVTERAAKLKVRVGIFGDKTKSEMVLKAIEKNL